MEKTWKKLGKEFNFKLGKKNTFDSNVQEKFANNMLRLRLEESYQHLNSPEDNHPV